MIVKYKDAEKSSNNEIKIIFESNEYVIRVNIFNYSTYMYLSTDIHICVNL